MFMAHMKSVCPAEYANEDRPALAAENVLLRAGARTTHTSSTGMNLQSLHESIAHSYTCG